MSEERTADDIMKELEKMSGNEVTDEVDEPEQEEAVEEAEVEEAEESSEEESEEQSEEESADEEGEESTESEETESDEPEVKPDNAAFARMRREKKRLERELAEAKRAKEDDGAKALSDTMTKIARALESGDGSEGALISKVRGANVSELTAAYEEALSGKFGEQGNEMIELIERAMPMAQTREVRRNENEKQNQQRLRAEYDAEVEEANQDYPVFADPESDGGKFASKLSTELIGYNEKSGTFDGALSDQLAGYLESHPQDRAAIFNAVYESNKKNSDSAVESKEVAKLKKKIEILERDNGKLKGLEDPSARRRTSTKKGDTAEDIKQKLIEMSNK